MAAVAGNEGEARFRFLNGLAEPSPASGQGEGHGQRPAEPLSDPKALAEGGTVRGTVAAAAEKVCHESYSPPHQPSSSGQVSFTAERCGSFLEQGTSHLPPMCYVLHTTGGLV